MGAFDGELAALGYSSRSQSASGGVEQDLVRVEPVEGLECIIWTTMYKTALIQILHIYEKFIVFKYITGMPDDKALHDHCSSNQYFYVSKEPSHDQ